MALRAFLQRLALAWHYLWHPLPDANTYNLRVISMLIHSPLSQAVRQAVEKVAHDPTFHPTKEHLKKHAEAITAVKWYYNGAVPAWEAGFLLEWWVGVRKGKLHEC